MALKYTKANLKKIEEIFISHEFSIRYERGQFKSGYCILRDKKIIVVNKFFKEKGRIESLLDIIQQIDIQDSKLTPDGKKILSIVEKGYLEDVAIEQA